MADIKVGDKVKITGRGSFNGMKGRVVWVDGSGNQCEVYFDKNNTSRFATTNVLKEGVYSGSSLDYQAMQDKDNAAFNSLEVGDRVTIKNGPMGGLQGKIGSVNDYRFKVIRLNGGADMGTYSASELIKIQESTMINLKGILAGKPLQFMETIKAALDKKAKVVYEAEKKRIGDKLFENPETPGQNIQASDVVANLDIKKKAVADAQDESDEKDVDDHQDMYDHLRGEKIGQQKP
jgi:ribosomal protein L24